MEVICICLKNWIDVLAMRRENAHDFQASHQGFIQLFIILLSALQLLASCSFDDSSVYGSPKQRMTKFQLRFIIVKVSYSVIRAIIQFGRTTGVTPNVCCERPRVKNVAVEPTNVVDVRPNIWLHHCAFEPG